MIDLTNEELFKDLTSLSMNGENVDLHNNFLCTKLNYDNVSESLGIIFEPRRDSGLLKHKVSLIFKNVVIAKFEWNFSRSEDTGILNSFYRGRFEQNGELFEYSSPGKGYYYVEFEEGDKFELFSNNVLLMENYEI